MKHIIIKLVLTLTIFGLGFYFFLIKDTKKYEPHSISTGFFN